MQAQLLCIVHHAAARAVGDVPQVAEQCPPLAFLRGAVQRRAVADGVCQVLEVRHVGERRLVLRRLLAGLVVERVAAAAQSQRAAGAVEADKSVALASIAFVWLYASRHKLGAVMVAHALNDVLGFVVWPLLA